MGEVKYIIFALACGGLFACSPPAARASVEAAPIAPPELAMEAAEPVVEAPACAPDLERMLANGYDPSDPDTHIDPDTGAPYCGLEVTLNELHAADPRYDAALDLLKGDEVIKGFAVARGAYPETVLLTRTAAAQLPLCTGVLVAPNAVLSAAHCVDEGVAAPGALVTFGASLDTPLHQARIAQTILPPASGPVSRLDLVLVRLEAPVPETLRVASLATAEDLNAARAGRVVGFGLTERGTFGEKRQTDVAIVSRSCSGEFTHRTTGAVYRDSAYYKCLSGRELVAGAVRARATESNDTCSGDSGGPIFIAPATEASTRLQYVRAMASGTPGDAEAYRLAAITSRGLPRSIAPTGASGCGNGGIYVRVSPEVAEWIRVSLVSSAAPDTP